MNDKSFGVCMRVEDLPDPIEGSTKDRCEECGREVWVSKGMKETKIRVSDLLTYCMQCIVKVAGVNPPDVMEVHVVEDR